MGGKVKNKIDYISLLLFAVTLAAPAMYLMGLSYNHGTLQGWGIEASHFPISIQEAYVSAYYATTHFLSDVVDILLEFIKTVFGEKGIFLSIAAIVGASTFFFLIIKTIKNRETIARKKMFIFLAKKISYFHPDNNDFSKSLSFAGLISYFIFIAIYMFFLFFLFWCLFYVPFYLKGLNVATEEIEKLNEHGCNFDKKTKWEKCVILNDSQGNIIIDGFLIVRNEKELAIYKDNMTTILKFPEQYSFIKKRVIANTNKNDLE
ncbi:MAG: hypothetical protein K6L75_12270 [Cellvibrionaceae bacterium]